MGNTIVIILLVYLSILFLIANYAERKFKENKYLLHPSLIYALSITVYCTAWTFFGSIGAASRTGIGFLPTYLGPTLFMPIIGIVLLKIIRISKSQHITSIADFISSRYGKNVALGMLVAFFCVIGIIPYIAIQLKAINTCIQLLSVAGNHQVSSFLDTTFIITLLLAFFIIIYGLRNIDTTERHTGIVTAIAFESIVKLIAFLVAGIYIVYFLFNGIGDIFQQASKNLSIANLYNFPENSNPFSWFLMLLISGLAIILLPRQFQVAVVENTEENHLKKTMWLFPLYLFLINIFVLPIAIAGKLLLSANADADMYLLSLPLFKNQLIIGYIVFIGGFSAATSMLIVETIALTNMISNNIIVPLVLDTPRQKKISTQNLNRIIIISRRLGVFVILLMAYAFEKLVAEQFSLVSIGIISFAAVAQFAPAMLFGLYWKKANSKAAGLSIVVGFICWSYMLILPSFANANTTIDSIVNNGLFHLAFLKPTAFLGLKNFDVISHGIFWSLIINISVFVIVSINTTVSQQEKFQAMLFVDINQHLHISDKSQPWKGITLINDLKLLLENFLGKDRSTLLLEGYAKRHAIPVENNAEADSRLVAFTERILGGVIGVASSRIIISSITKDEQVTKEEVLNIVKESQHFIELNKEMKRKTLELTKVSNELLKANELLKNMDEQKDEFLYTVTHELRTPLSSIRALSEILYDNPDLEEEQRSQFLNNIVKETERLSHLITQVLNLEKYESGKQRLIYTSFNYNEMIDNTIASLQPLWQQKKIQIKKIIPNSELIIYADKNMLIQILNNLLSNAIKFAPNQNGIITVRVNEIDGEISTEIEDNGKGIEKDSLQLIFDKFFQAKNQTLKKPEGSGLGLAICKKIIEMHQGKIWVESEVNKYTKFLFTLPIQNII